MSSWRVACVIAAATITFGCTGGKPANKAGAAPPPQGSGDAEYRQCGTETYGHGNGYDPKMRDCLWQGVTDGQPVAFTTVLYTVEGDPITYTIQAGAPGHGPRPRFSVRVDSKDRFGRQGQFRYACTAIQKVERKYEAEQRNSFRFSGCTGTESESEFDVP